jgi:hypothetical protein
MKFSLLVFALLFALVKCQIGNNTVKSAETNVEDSIDKSVSSESNEDCDSTPKIGAALVNLINGNKSNLFTVILLKGG